MHVVIYFADNIVYTWIIRKCYESELIRKYDEYDTKDSNTSNYLPLHPLISSRWNIFVQDSWTVVDSTNEWF